LLCVRPSSIKTHADRFALAVAITKANVIELFFMHIKGSSPVLHLAAVAGVIWLLFLISLTLGDYLTSGWVPFNR